MPQLYRVVAEWTGGRVGTGYSNLFFASGVSTQQACADAVRAFFSSSYSVGAGLPVGVQIQVRGVVDTIEETNGELTDSTSVTTPAVIAGSDSSRYAAVAGACVTWRTGDFVAGRRVRGRTFLVPVGGQMLQADGTLDTTFLGFINTAAAALIAAAPELRVWRRPSGPGASDGSSHLAASGLCSDKTAFLTSRR